MIDIEILNRYIKIEIEEIRKYKNLTSYQEGYCDAMENVLSYTDQIKKSQ